MYNYRAMMKALWTHRNEPEIKKEESLAPPKPLWWMGISKTFKKNDTKSRPKSRSKTTKTERHLNSLMN